MWLRFSYVLSRMETTLLITSSDGATVVTVDLRGQGESSERAAHGNSFGYREIVELDIPAAFSMVRSLGHVLNQPCAR